METEVPAAADVLLQVEGLLPGGALGGVEDAHVGGAGRPPGLVNSADIGSVGSPHAMIEAAGSDGRPHFGHVGVLRVGSPATAGSLRRRHHLETSRNFLTGTEEGENFPAEDNADGPENEEMEKYPRVGEDEERILEEVSDVHGWARSRFYFYLEYETV